MTKIKAASLLVHLYATYHKNNVSSECYEEAIAMAIMALSKEEYDLLQDGGVCCPSGDSNDWR